MPNQDHLFEIEFCSGPRDGETVPVRAEQAIVGRGREVDVEATGDKSVSGRRTKIALNQGRIFVEDLGGGMTTMVNGETVLSPREVSDGDVVCVGRTEFILRRPGERQVRQESSVGRVSRTVEM